MSNNSSVNTVKKEDRYLVIVVDMDDDVGRKANIKTPVLGIYLPF